MSTTKRNQGTKEIVTNFIHNFDNDPEIERGGFLLGSDCVKIPLKAGTKWFIPQGVPAVFTKESSGGVISTVSQIFNTTMSAANWDDSTTTGFWSPTTQQLLGDVVHSDELTQWWREETGVDTPITSGVTWTEAFTDSFAQSFPSIGTVTKIPEQVSEGVKWFLRIGIPTISAGALLYWQRLASTILEDFMIQQE